MKLIKITTIILALFFPGFYANGIVDDTSKTTIMLNGERTGTRPRVPELQYVRCILDDGMLLLDMEVAEGICELYAEPLNGAPVSTIFDSAELCSYLWVGEYDEVYVELRTEWGNVYYGTIYLE